MYQYHVLESSNVPTNIIQLQNVIKGTFIDISNQLTAKRAAMCSIVDFSVPT